MTEDQRRTGLEAALRWSWATLRQIDRMHEIEAVLSDEAVRRPTRFDYEHRIPFWERATETHYWAVAVRQLLRALAVLDPPADRTDFPHLEPGTARHARLLRDCFEHWDEADVPPGNGPAGRAHRQLQKLTDGGDPGQYRFGAGGTIVGGLSLDDVENACRALHAYLCALEATSFVWRGWDALAPPGRAADD